MKITAKSYNKETFQAGKYICTDPCYLRLEGDNFWSEFCNQLFKISDKPGALMVIGKTPIFVCGTTWGDGSYNIYKDNKPVGEMGVDAGLLSLIPYDAAVRWAGAKKVKDYIKRNLAAVIQSEKDFSIEVFGDEREGRAGNWRFLDYEVITDDSKAKDDYCKSCGRKCEC